MRFSGLYLALFPSRLTRLPTQLFSACALTAALTACGGSSDSSPDRTPNSFSFATQSNAELGAQATSPAVTITSISNNTPISITGGEYSIDGGAFTSAAGTINNNQTVRVRTTAGDAFGDVSTVSLTIGETTASFNATTLDQDITPDALTFAAISDAALGTQVASAAQTIAGINDAAPISIAGGEYSIDGGDFTAEAGTIEAGSSVVVQLLTSTDFNTASTATLTVGELASAFSATTALQDTTPDAISFTPATDAEFGATVSSATQTISGINSPAPISIAGGQYKINDNAFTSAAGTVNAGDVVVVSVVAGDTIDIETAATITVGGEASVFNVTTVGDTTPPVAEVFFPTPTTFTDGESVTVRGAATDDFGPISQISFTVSAANGTQNDPVILKAPEGESLDTWMQSVPLIVGQANTISIIAIDAAGNEQTDAVELSITQGSELRNFPEGAFETESSAFTVKMEYDEVNNRLLQLVPPLDDFSNSVFLTQLGMLEIDIISGEQDFVFKFEQAEGWRETNDLLETLLDPNNQDIVYISGDSSLGEIFKVDLTTGNLLEAYDVQTVSVLIFEQVGMEFIDRDVILYNAGNLYTFNVMTGENELFLAQAEGDRNSILEFYYDVDSQRVFYIENNSQSVFVYDIETAQVTDLELAEFFPLRNRDSLREASGIVYDAATDTLILANSENDIILSVNVGTNEVSVLSSVDQQPRGANPITNPRLITDIGNRISVINESGREYFNGDDKVNNNSVYYVLDTITGERVVLSSYVAPRLVIND